MDEPNNSSLTATPLALTVAKAGYVSSPSDTDWFKIDVNQTGVLNVNLTVPSGKDYDLELYGPDNLWVAGSYSLEGQNERMDFSALQTGTYYARVYGYPVGAGAFDTTRPYQITASLSATATGTINSNVVWSGVVNLTGDVTINSGASLTIQPGTVVRCAGGDSKTSGLDNNRIEIILNGGTLNLQGTQASPVTFTSARTTKAPGDWYGIRLKSGDISLANCVVEFASEGIRFESTDTRFNTYALAGVTVQRCTGNGVWTTSGQFAQPLLMNDFQLIGNAVGLRAEGPVTLTGGEIKNSASFGINASTTLVMTGTTVRINGASGINNGGNTTLTDCLITYNGASGISNSGGRTTLANCAITDNQGDGVYCGDSILTMEGCTVSRNNGWGVNSNGYGRTSEISNNNVQSNGNGIALSNSLTVGIIGNTISGNTGVGLQLNLNAYYGPAGISATGITGNSIRNNGGVGVQVHGNQPAVLTLTGNDIHQNTGFELRNDSGIPIVAGNGFWGDPTAKEIDLGQANLTKIYDRNDNASNGVVSIPSQRSSTLLQLPIFDLQPLHQAVAFGGTVILSVHSTGSAPITYQWYRNGNVIANATQQNLNLTSLDSSKAGTYYAVATNGAGKTTSESAIITLIPTPVVPTIVQQPLSQVVPLGASVNFTIAVTGTAPFSYQWRKNGVPIPGAGNATFSIASALLGDAAEYSVFVSNNSGSVTSNTVALTVNIRFFVVRA
jgi:hypothetical protein